MDDISPNELAIFQSDSGAIELKVDGDAQTIWASQKQLAELFDVKVNTINEHLVNIFMSSELDANSVIRNFRITANDGKNYDTKHYNLDAIISVGYRVNSRKATSFRQWATKTLRQYIVEGFVVDPSRVKKNTSHFMQAMEDLKLLAKNNQAVGSTETTELSKQFAMTWLSLDAYDKSNLPQTGTIKKQVELKAVELHKSLLDLKNELIDKGEATELFAQEKNAGSLEGLFGNVFQSFGGEDVYPSLEEKAAHLLYFVVKNHVFNDGNKRSGAYSFVWFLKEVDLLNTAEISPQALTAITLLVAESDPKNKEKMIGLILLMLGTQPDR